MTRVRVGRRSLDLSHDDKLLFGAGGPTKGELVEYYHRVAEVMLPHLADRPLALQRFPDGIEEDGFFQKAVPDSFPEWVDRARVDTAKGAQTLVVCSDVATLVFLADQAAITLHGWLSRRDKLRHPDRLVFDLDPPGDDFESVRAAARYVHELLDELGLVAYVQTTGSRGLHVVVPLDRSATYDDARDFARDVADLLVGRHPQELTTEQRKAKRRSRLYLDVMRNAYGQTAVAPYSVRPKSGAPVATPLEWDELGSRDLGPRAYTIQNLFRRLAQRGDPWKGFGRRAHALREPRARLDRLRAERDR